MTQIPDAAIEAAAEAMWDIDHGLYRQPWESAEEGIREDYRTCARAAYPATRAAVLAEVATHLADEARDAEVGTKIGNKYYGVMPLSQWIANQMEPLLDAHGSEAH